MAPRTNKTPKPRKGKKGDNSLTMEQEAALSAQLLENIRLHKLKAAGLKTKMSELWEEKVVSLAKKLGMLQGDVMAFYEDHAIETGKDDDAVEKANRKRARRLDTYNRLYAATHDGTQLDLLEMAAVAAKAAKEAEEMIDAPKVKEDSEE